MTTPIPPLPHLTYNPATKTYCLFHGTVIVNSTRDPVAALSLLRKHSKPN